MIYTNKLSISRIMTSPKTSVLMHLIRLSDTETYTHSIRVAELALKILKIANKYDSSRTREIITGALLHDIGKIFLPFHITAKPDILSTDEYDIIKSHPTLSYTIVKNDFSPIVQHICLYHHYSMDGTGYPSCPADTLLIIPDYVFLVQLCDKYDALVSERCYKPAIDKSVAITMMYDDYFDNLFLPSLVDVVLS